MEKLTSSKKCIGIALDIAVIISLRLVTILQIIGLFFLSGFATLDSNKPIMTPVTDFIQKILKRFSKTSTCDLTIPPLIAIITINACVIFCTTMKRVSSNYCKWKGEKTGKILTRVYCLGLMVSFFYGRCIPGPFVGPKILDWTQTLIFDYIILIFYPFPN